MNIFMALALSKEDLRLCPGDIVVAVKATDESDDIRDRAGAAVVSLIEGVGVLSRSRGLSLLRENDLLRRGLGRIERASICS